MSHSQYVGIFSPELYIDRYVEPSVVEPSVAFALRKDIFKSEPIYYYMEKVNSLIESMKLVDLYYRTMPIELRSDLQIKTFSEKPILKYGQKVKSPNELFKLELDKYQKFMQPKNDSVGKIKLYWHKLKNGDVVACCDHKFGKYQANYVGSNIPIYVLVKDSDHHYHFNPIDHDHPTYWHWSPLLEIGNSYTIVETRRENIKYSGKAIKEALNKLALDYKYVAYSFSSIEVEK